MVESGIREVQVLAQDTTRYGTDLNGGESLLEPLLEQINALPYDFRFRVYYLYPDTLTFDHLERLAKLDKMLPYFDIPFQHASERVLKLMGRHYDRGHIDELLHRIRSLFPGSFIRTSFIVGFPGETTADFEMLLEFVRRERFESVGVFEYHDEPLAASSKLPNKVEEPTIKERRETLSAILKDIYTSHDLARRSTPQHGYIMELKAQSAIIRREIAAPEVDEYDEVAYSVIGTRKKELNIGSFVPYIYEPYAI